MKLYWCPRTRAQRAIWMLEEVGIGYERVDVDIRGNPDDHPADFRCASPMGKVPAIRDGEVAMSESAAICLYLADRYSPGELAPTLDDDARGRYLYWMLYTPAVIEPAMGEKIRGAEPNRFSNGWGDFESMISTLEDGYGEGPWILGDRFTAADVMVGGSVVFLRQFGMLPESAALEAYADRCAERPGYRTASALDEAAS